MKLCGPLYETDPITQATTGIWRRLPTIARIGLQDGFSTINSAIETEEIGMAEALRIITTVTTILLLITGRRMLL